MSLESWERDLHVSRIISSTTRITASGVRLLLGPASIETRYSAAEVYRDIWQECHAYGVMTDDDALDILKKRGLWTRADENEHKILVDKIEDMKMGLYENWSRSNARLAIRLGLSKGKAELERLDARRHTIDHLTCEGIAASGRVRYLTGFSLLCPNGEPYWASRESWNLPDSILDEVLDLLIRGRLGESDYRELARTDPWKSIWTGRKYCGRGMFDMAAVDLTPEQSYMIMWSNLYDTIREHPDSPEESMFEDNDMLDGWLIFQRKKRESHRAKKQGDDIKNDKIRNADEVYVLADSVDDARRIERMNDMVGTNIKAQRMAVLKSKGTMSELEMPDTWARIQMEARSQMSARLKGEKS